mgnify:CR=1 FL=1
MKSNPWFWGGLSRWEFERNLVKDAVLLRDKNARVVVKKHSIEEVRARKNALDAKGVLVNVNSLNNIITTLMPVCPRKIK